LAPPNNPSLTNSTALPSNEKEFESDGEHAVREHIARDYYGEVKLQPASCGASLPPFQGWQGFS
jgi:hypothetical protein